MTRCKQCKRRFFHYSERRSLNPIITEISNRHIHHGLPIFRYGICSHNHYTKLERIRIEWSPCLKCCIESLRFSKTGPLRIGKRRTRSARAWRPRKDTPRPKSLRCSSARVPKFLYKEVYGESPSPCDAPPSSPVLK